LGVQLKLFFNIRCYSNGQGYGSGCGNIHVHDKERTRRIFGCLKIGRKATRENSRFFLFQTHRQDLASLRSEYSAHVASQTTQMQSHLAAVEATRLAQEVG
jgi:hypothetical protein